MFEVELPVQRPWALEVSRVKKLAPSAGPWAEVVVRLSVSLLPLPPCPISAQDAWMSLTGMTATLCSALLCGRLLESVILLGRTDRCTAREVYC